MNIVQFAYPLYIDGYLSCFQFEAIINSAALNIFVYISL